MTESPRHPGYVVLRAGPLVVDYDPALGDLRCVRWGGVEAIRRIYGAIRGPIWETVPPRITETERTIGADSFRIAYTSRNTEGPIDFRWQATITGAADGTVTFTFDGEALQGFRRNRIGLCVLHPADLAGSAVTVTHTDGERENGAFPDLISPTQPFFDIASISHDVAPGVRLTVRFEGDVFEMEDQRNWLDASFKTYSTPHDLPFPVDVPAGTRVRQTVTLSVDGPAAMAPPAAEPDRPVVVAVGEVIPDVSIPTLSLIQRDFDAALPEATESLLAFLPIAGLHRSLNAADPAFAEALVRAIHSTERAGKRLTVALRNADRLPDAIPPEAESVYLWYLVPPTEAAWRRAWEVLPNFALYIGAASAPYFTELNCERPSPAVPWDYVIFPANPQVHAFDEVSIRETPPIVAAAIRTARAFTDASPSIGPLTFYGPYQSDDPRQKTAFAACWYLAVLGNAIPEDVADITLCETVGPRGVMDADGTTYPIYDLLMSVGSALNEARKIRAVTVSDPLAVAALALKTASGGNQVFLANLTSEPVPTVVEFVGRTHSLSLAGHSWTELPLKDPS